MAHQHTEEFRSEAVRLALTSGLSRKQVAADLGVGFSTLSRWIKLHRQWPSGNNSVQKRPTIGTNKELLIDIQAATYQF